MNQIADIDEFLSFLSEGHEIKFEFEGRYCTIAVCYVKSLFKKEHTEYWMSTQKKGFDSPQKFYSVQDVLDAAIAGRKLRDIVSEITIIEHLHLKEVFELYHNGGSTSSSKNLKELLNLHYDIEFIYQGKGYYMGRCYIKKKELYYIKAEDEPETKIINDFQSLLDTKVGDKRLEEIANDIEITDLF